MAQRASIWLADLFRAAADLTPDADTLAEIGRLLQVDAVAVVTPWAPIPPPPPERFAEAAEPLPIEDAEALEAAAEGARREDSWRVYSEPVREPADPTAAQPPAWFSSVTPLAVAPGPPPRPPRPLLPRLQRRAILASALAVRVPEGGLDLRPVLRTLSHGLPLLSLPRRSRRTLRFGVEVLMDRAPWLEPFQADQRDLVAYLRTLMPSDRLSRRRCLASPVDTRPRRLAARGPRPDPQAPVLALTDLGAGYRSLGTPPPDLAQWRRFARTMAKAGRSAVLLQPIAAPGWTAPAGIGWLPWSERTTVRDAACLFSRRAPLVSPDGGEADEADVLRLARVLSPAVRIDPWLLREARHRFLPRRDPGLEAALWFSPLVASRGDAGIVLDSTILADLRRELAGDPPTLRDAAIALVATAHAAESAPQRLEETLIGLELQGRLGGLAVEEALRPALKTLVDEEPGADDLAMWAAHAWGRFSPALRESEAARQFAYAAALRLPASRWLSAPAEGAPALPMEAAWLVGQGAAGRTELGLELRQFADDTLELWLHPPGPVTNAFHRLSVPSTSPLWLEIAGPSEPSRSVAVGPGTRLPLPESMSWPQAELTLRTVAGDRLRLRLENSLEAVVAPSTLTGSELSAPVEGRPPTGPAQGLVIGPELAMVWNDDGPDGERRRFDAAGREVWGIRLGRLGEGGEDGRPPLSVFRLEPPPNGGVEIFDGSARLGSAQARDAGLGLLWDGKGDLRATTVVRLEGGRYRSEGGWSAAGGLAVEPGSGWQVLWDIQAAGSRWDELEAAPLGQVLAAVHALARARPRFFLISPTFDLSYQSKPLLEQLAKALGPWRLLTAKGSLSRGEDWRDELKRLLNQSEAALVVDPRLDLASDWVRFALSLVAEQRLPVLLVPEGDAGRQALLMRTLNEQGIVSPKVLPLLTGDLRADRGNSAARNRVVTAIAGWRLPPLAGLPAEGEESAVTEGAKKTGVFAGLRASLARQIGRRIEANQPAPGLYRVLPEGDFSLGAFVTPRGEAPLLILLHSLSASGQSTFGPLWTPPARQELGALSSAYGDRVFSFEHHAATRTPVANALQLAQALPPGAVLHFLTHSAGGLIGELFARASRVDGREPFDEVYQALLAPLGPEIVGQLAALSRELQSKRFRVERYVRVACPARGTRIFSESPNQALDLMSGVAAVFNPVLGLAGSAIGSAVQIFRDREALPGFALQAPESPMIALLKRSEVQRAAPLAVVMGVRRPGGLWGRLTDLVARRVAFQDDDNDLMVSLFSARGGVQRAAPAMEFIAEGPEVDHFTYFTQATSRQAMVRALLGQTESFRPLGADTPPPEPRMKKA